MSGTDLTIPPGPSELADHGTTCCSIVRLDLVSRARHQMTAENAIAIVPRLIRWGATRWPAYWCDMVHEGGYRGDCGVHADVVTTVARTYGLRTGRGFAILSSGQHRVAHWRARWEASGLVATWLGDRNAFHELVYIESIGWWDPSEARPVVGVGEALEAGRVVALETDWTSLVMLPEHR